MTKLNNLKEEIVTKGQNLAHKAMDIGANVADWTREHPEQTVYIVTGVVGVVAKVHHSHISNKLMKAEIRSKNAYADKFGER